MAGVSLSIKDTGGWQILKDLNMTLSCGLHEEQGVEIHGNGPLSVVEVAEINEFGAGKVPARPWLRGWADNAPAKKIVSQIRSVLVTMVRTQDFEPTPMQEVTVGALTSMASQFLAGKLLPNAPLTLLKKAPETRPLIEHQQLVQALRARLNANIWDWAFEADAPTVSGPQAKF